MSGKENHRLYRTAQGDGGGGVEDGVGGRELAGYTRTAPGDGGMGGEGGGGGGGGGGGRSEGRKLLLATLHMF